MTRIKETVLSPGCPLPAYLGHIDHAANFPGGSTFQLKIIICGALFTGIACLAVLYTVTDHLRHYAVPREQRLIVRIAILPAVYALCCVFSLSFYGLSLFLEPVTRVFEAVGVVALFELYVLCISSSVPAERDVFFQNLARLTMFRKKQKHDKGSLRWFRIAWLCVFQFIPTTIATVIASEITAARDCSTSDKARRDILIQRVISAIFTGICVTGIVAFYIRFRRDLKPFRATRKLVCIKLLVGVVVFQTILFSALAKAKLYKDTPHLSYYDWYYGVPNILSCAECVLFSGLFAWSFSASRYRREEPLSAYSAPTSAPAKSLGFSRALLDTLNLVDVLRNVWIAMTILVRLPFGYKGLQFANPRPNVMEKRLASDSSTEKDQLEQIQASKMPSLQIPAALEYHHAGHAAPSGA